MNATVRADFGASWYAGDGGRHVRAAAPHLRYRRRRMRDRRRARRPDRGPRGRAPRLVGRRARGAARRVERVRPQLRLRAAGIRRRPPPHGRARRASIAPGELWQAVRGRRRLCPHDHPRYRDAGRRAGERLARRLQGRQRRRDARHRDPARTGIRRRRSRAGRPSGCARRSRATSISTPFTIRAHSTSIRSPMRTDSPERRSPPAPSIFEETPALAIDPAGVRKRITTPLGRVRAAHIVLAGNAHLGALVPRPRRDGAAGDRLCGGHRAARRAARRGDRVQGARSATRASATTSTGSSAAIG